MIKTDQHAFLADVQHHQMTVLRDDGLYRHLRFRRPGTVCRSFDLLTYPGGLLYRGDMGAFAFERLEDMFEFFRADGGRINPWYWSGKLVTVDRDGRSSVTEFDAEQFDREIVFDNPWEMSCDRYTHGFLWCCHALVWGIAKYDEMKAREKVGGPAVEGCAA